MFLFRKQYQLPQQTQDAINQICLFACLIYVQAWIKCPLTSDAALNDLNMYNNLTRYEAIDATVSRITINKLKNHLWYLSPELILLALFSNEVPNAEKELMVQTAIKKDKPLLKRRSVRTITCKTADNKRLHNFVGPQSLSLLRNLPIEIKFIYDYNPAQWKNLDQYKFARETVNSINVVNDLAERKVALASAYNTTLTLDEEERQRIFQSVEFNRKKTQMYYNKKSKKSI